MAFKPRAFATVFGGMLQMGDENTSIGLVSGPNLSPHCFLTASRNVGPKESGWELRSQLLYDFADGRISFGDSDHEISDIRTRDGEAETRQVAFPDPVLPRRRPICKFGWAHDGPVESTLPHNVLHTRSIGYRIAKNQPSQNTR